MKIKRSFDEKQPTLFIVGTPIGNLEDISFRAINTLKEVDMIYAEDTRHTQKLLNHFDIKTPIRSYHEHNETLRRTELLTHLHDGKSLALVSDAGMPTISDPGKDIVQTVAETDYPIVSIPGPSAFLIAYTLSSFAEAPFIFIGFLPTKQTQRKIQLKRLKTTPYTLIFYEAPHRLQTMLKDLKEVFGERKITIARELTKRFETVYEMTLSALDDLPKLKGELVVVVEGFKDNNLFSDDDLVEHVKLFIEDGHSEMAAIKEVAKIRKQPKNKVYMAYQTYKHHFETEEEE